MIIVFVRTRVHLSQNLGDDSCFKEAPNITNTHALTILHILILISWLYSC